jgi:hypothetical protein
MTADSAAVRATKGKPMKPWTTYDAGFNWARDHHDVVIMDRQSQIVADFRIEHSLAGWQQFRAVAVHVADTARLSFFRLGGSAHVHEFVRLFHSRFIRQAGSLCHGFHG